MQEIISIFKEFGPYVALPVIVYFIVNGLKSKIPFFKTVIGLRVVHFLPVVLGSIGGLLLPEGTLGVKMLVGGGLGSLSHLIYKFVSVTLANKVILEKKLSDKRSVNEEIS